MGQWSEESRKNKSRAQMRTYRRGGLIGVMYELVRESPMTQYEIAQAAGINESTLSGWHTRDPRLNLFEAVLNTLGYRLEIVRDDD